MRKRLLPYGFVSPAIFFMAAFFVFPLLMSFLASLRSMRLWEYQTGGQFVGFDNYVNALQDPQVQNSIRVTVTFMATTVALELVIGMAIAVLLHRSFRGRRFVRAMVLVPMMVTPVVVGLTFRLMFNRQFGPVNWFLGLFGIDPLPWLSDPALAMVAVIVTEVWNQTPFVVLVMLAGLQTIPEELYEASRLDGASPWQAFWSISLPLLVPMLLVAGFWRSVATFRIFDVIAVMTDGGPVNATQALSLRVRTDGFEWGLIGYANAVSYLMVVALLIMAYIYNRILRGMEEGRR